MTTIPIQVDFDYRLFAEQFADVLAERGLLVAAAEPDTLIEASEVRAMLGRAPGRPLSYPTLQKYIATGRLTPASGPDRRSMYFSRKQVENLIGK